MRGRGGGGSPNQYCSTSIISFCSWIQTQTHNVGDKVESKDEVDDKEDRTILTVFLYHHMWITINQTTKKCTMNSVTSLNHFVGVM